MHSWTQALFGGSLIGAAASLLLLASGRIAGISGIAGGLVNARPSDRLWRVSFVAGLAGGGFLMSRSYPTAFGAAGLSTAYLLCAGLLVGVGTSLANGCTSGHGICGVSRLSKRSLVATSTFMAFGVLAAVVARHVLGVGGAA